MATVYYFPGDLPATHADPKVLTAVALLELLKTAVAPARLITLENPAELEAYTLEKGDFAVMFWTDKFPAEMRAMLFKYPTRIIFLNHAMVKTRNQHVRATLGYPSASAHGKVAPLPELPPNRVLKVLDKDDVETRRQGRQVVIMLPTEAAAIFHGTTVEKEKERALIWAGANVPEPDIKYSMHPNDARRLGVPTTDELVPTAHVMISLQSGAVIDKGLDNGINVIVDSYEHGLGGCMTLPGKLGWTYITDPTAAEKALLQAGANEYPVTAEGLQKMLQLTA